jgi:hypothetical protein
VTLTGHSRDELAEWLAQMRDVARLAGDEALDATDRLLWAYQEWRATGPPDPDDGLERDLTELRERMASLAALLERGGEPRPYEADVLRAQVESVGRSMDATERERHGDQLAAIRTEAGALITRLHQAQHRAALTKALSHPLLSAVSVTHVLAAVEQAERALRDGGGWTPELEAQAREARTRAAEFRARKKSDEADVAAAGGNTRKAERLRAEAAAMLAQDRRKAGLDA